MTLVEFPADGGPDVLVQLTHDQPPETVTRGIGLAQPIERAEHSFGHALSTIQSVADGVLQQLQSLAQRPDEVHVEFGLELCATAHIAVLAAAGGTAHLRVELTWSSSGQPTPQPEHNSSNA